MTCAPCFAASSMYLRCRSTIASLLPAQAVWTSAAFTFAIPTSPPSRLRRLAQLLREADQLVGSERAADLVLHPIGDPRERDRLARREGVEDRAAHSADRHRDPRRWRDERAVRRYR